MVCTGHILSSGHARIQESAIDLFSLQIDTPPYGVVKVVVHRSSDMMCSHNSNMQDKHHVEGQQEQAHALISCIKGFSKTDGCDDQAVVPCSQPHAECDACLDSEQVVASSEPIDAVTATSVEKVEPAESVHANAESGK